MLRAKCARPRIKRGAWTDIAKGAGILLVLVAAFTAREEVLDILIIGGIAFTVVVIVCTTVGPVASWTLDTIRYRRRVS